MRKTALTLLVVAATLGVTAGAAAGPRGSDNGTMCVENTQLRGENELPPTTSEAKGHTQIKVRNDGTIEYRFFILNKANEPFFAGHIHREIGDTGIGPPIVTLFATQTSGDRIRGSGEVEGQEALAQDICDNPSRYYINFHTNPGFPAGAIRGDLG